MKKLYLSALPIALTLTCLAQQYQINAGISGFPEGTKFMLKNLDVDVNIDSAVIRNQSFTMKGNLQDPPLSMWLCTTYKNTFYYLILLMGNDTISVKGDLRDFPFDLSVRGSRIQDDRNALNELTKGLYGPRTGMITEYLSLKGDSAAIKGAALLQKIHTLDSTTTAVRKKFVYEHKDTYVALQEMFFLKNQLARDSLRALFSSVPAYLRQSNFGVRISNYLRVGDAVKAGDSMVDFAAYDRAGKLRRPSEYRGRYILLDFSTTWCGPCMQSVKDMKKMTAGYGDRLKIVSLSGDGGKNTWLEGIERDKPGWLNLWDGKGVYGEAMLKYGVSGFPTFCLIGPDGKIVKLWTGYGTNTDGSGSLETEVARIMGK